MSKNLVEPERPQTMWCMRVACWVSKATRAQGNPPLTHARTHPRAHMHTHKYVIIFAFPQQQWFRKRASVLRYTYIEYLV